MYFYAQKLNQMDLIRLYVEGITSSFSLKDTYTVILSASKKDVKLPITIGPFEAQAIALQLDKKIVPPRPLTHNLFRNFANLFQIELEQVFIHKMVDNVFYSVMIFKKEGQEYQLDARTSDAIALALHFNASILTTEEVLQKAGIQMSIYRNQTDDSTIKPSLEAIDSGKGTNTFAKYSLSKLKDMLNDCIESEDYEMAAQIRDEISKRNSL